ncbi:OmpA family protein [Falsiroseomonas tokyonensis]|uniref:OmpA family protein n=1 Tax=Falsiroseomonas tokyonensis TaxID=430521 RepID=A0ABV7C5K0_9PROT|nr:OmpA family protein [Falsiroseomonas tokyonensis]MBU8541578.1 OmpA family protein [Falsiroseomonas tokyonensis]
MRRRAFALAGLLPAVILAACAADPRELVGQPPRVVFFEVDSVDLDEPAQAVLADAARLARRHPQVPVQVRGYAGPAGGAAFNRELSQRRAQQVADELIKRGVAASRIQVVGRGPVPFDSVPIESRRVEVIIGYP